MSLSLEVSVAGQQYDISACCKKGLPKRFLFSAFTKKLGVNSECEWIQQQQNKSCMCEISISSLKIHNNSSFPLKVKKDTVITKKKIRNYAAFPSLRCSYLYISTQEWYSRMIWLYVVVCCPSHCRGKTQTVWDWVSPDFCGNWNLGLKFQTIHATNCWISSPLVCCKTYQGREMAASDSSTFTESEILVSEVALCDPEKLYKVTLESIRKITTILSPTIFYFKTHIYRWF